MAYWAMAATRSLIRNGSIRASCTLAKDFSSCSPGGLPNLRKVLMNYASGGPEVCNFSACRAATIAVSLSYRCFYVATDKSPSTVKVGDKLFDSQLSYLDQDDSVELTDRKKVVLFAVPAAFSPTCSAKQMPAFVAKADELKARGLTQLHV
ncbi:unnamed protein product [Calypogeia fissa]